MTLRAAVRAAASRVGGRGPGVGAAPCEQQGPRRRAGRGSSWGWDGRGVASGSDTTSATRRQRKRPRDAPADPRVRACALISSRPCSSPPSSLPLGAAHGRHGRRSPIPRRRRAVRASASTVLDVTLRNRDRAVVVTTTLRRGRDRLGGDRPRRASGPGQVFLVARRRPDPTGSSSSPADGRRRCAGLRATWDTEAETLRLRDARPLLPWWRLPRPADARHHRGAQRRRHRPGAALPLERWVRRG